MRQDSQYAGNRNRRGSRNRRPGGSSETPRPPKKLTFWQKVVKFFGGSPAKTNGRPAVRETRIPTSDDRGSRHQEREDSERRFSDAPAREARESREFRQSRKPELVEVSSPKLYVGNLSFDAAENDLMELFNGVGSVQSAEIVSHRHTQKSKGFAFVMMQTVDEARRAVTELHDKDFMGRKLVVSGAKTSDVRHYDDSNSSDSAAA